MATTRKTGSTTAKKTTAAKTQEVQTPIADVMTSEVNQTHAVVAEPVAVEVPVAYRVKEVLSPNMFVTVKNGFNGKLVYKSRKTGESFIWDQFGDEQDIELQELKNAKSASRLFFENNWFMFDDPEVIAYLGVERYYKNALSLDKFDDIFVMNPEALKEKIAQLSSGQRNSVAYRARQLINEGEIDSRKVIAALEESLNIELIEK